ncbi:MAG: ECF-type sigma factor [Candidatus Eisenbacteria bacterium]
MDHPESETPGAHQADALYVTTYELLREEARRLVAGETPGHTLQPTALVHEAYLRLAGSEDQHWESRGHFMSVAARVMRRVLIDYARMRSAEKRGRGWSRVTFDEALSESGETSSVDLLDVIQLDRALEELERSHARMGRVAEMRLFGGMTADEMASSLGVSRRTVEGDWGFVRRWLAANLGGSGDGAPPNP